MGLKGIGIFSLMAFLLGQGFAVGMQEEPFNSSNEYDNSSNEYDSSEEFSCVVPQISLEEGRVGLENVELYVRDLLEKSKLNPDQIGLVLDVDGTLTNYSDPKAHQSPAQGRGNAVPFVKNCIIKGVRVVVSSAWTPFGETIQRLKDIGLGDVLGINGGEIQKGEQILFDTSVEYVYLGRVASVKGKTTDTDDYFRLKPFAFHYVFPNLDLKTIKYWIFADDNSDNISLFSQYIGQVYAGSQTKKEEVPDGVLVKMFYQIGRAHV